MPVTKASFNYYTINKKPIDFKEKIDAQLNKLKLQKDINSNIFNKSGIDNTIKNAIQQDINKFSENKVLLMGDIPPNIPYDSPYISLRQILKNIKATQKAKFNELMTKKETTLKTIEQDPTLYLFHKIDENKFQRYQELTQKLEEIATQLSKKPKNSPKLRIDKQNIAKERGSMLKDRKDLKKRGSKSKKDEFKEYWNDFMELYRSVAQEHGRILAKPKALKKNK